MNKLASLGLIALAYGGITVMTATDAPRVKVSAEAKAAAKQADRAADALRKHDAGAVGFAEAAVAGAPRVADYRMLLGQSYLQAGRFLSAEQAFADTLELDDGNGSNASRAALNRALAQIATGDWQAARATLATYAGVIPAGDRGLAMALAGDTAGAVALLTQVARSAAASPKVRQNLALAYALAGQWQVARVVASADMSPAEVDARIEQWAAFAQPTAASDQVAGLLGVRAAADGGQPAALALNPAAPGAAVMAVATVVSAPVAVASVAPVKAGIVFAPRREVVQALPTTMIASESGPIKIGASTRVASKPMRAAASPADGTWFVQIGAYDNAGVAKDAWGRAQRRFAGFAGRTANAMTFKAGGASYYRLSVGGFARADANRACRQYKARGGDCFVRAGAGDQVASWAKPGVQVAAR